MKDDLLKAYSLVISSETKIGIILSLSDRNLTPKRIAQKVQKRINHISAYLKKLKEGGIVICLNEDQKKGRLYILTDLGKQVYNELKRNGY